MPGVVRPACLRAALTLGQEPEVAPVGGGCDLDRRWAEEFGDTRQGRGVIHVDNGDRILSHAGQDPDAGTAEGVILEQLGQEVLIHSLGEVPMADQWLLAGLAAARDGDQPCGQQGPRRRAERTAAWAVHLVRWRRRPSPQFMR